MQWTDKLREVKIALVIAAVLIAVASLVVSHSLIVDLQQEEHHKMEVWAESMRQLINADENTDLGLSLKVLDTNHTIPVVVFDGYGNVMEWRNLKIKASNRIDSTQFVQNKGAAMKKAGRFMKLSLLQNDNVKVLKPNEFIEICYDESLMLKRLATYPFVQLGVVALFVVVAIIALLSSKRAEQNKVWVGLSRETAHQLGTPISSLMAWNTMLQETYPNDELLPEMEKDVKRLELVAERFSKIGSKPELMTTDMEGTLMSAVEYMKRRAPQGIKLHFQNECAHALANICAPLFQWVIENLCKNAIDAMPEGKGEISVRLSKGHESNLIVDVKDTGKGISKKNFKNVFKPGFTTKKRGWGLGLSLAKRIIEEYHNGKIFVKDSEVGKGTTFRIIIASVKQQ